MAKSQEEIKEDILSSLEKELEDILAFIENGIKKKNSNGTLFFDKDHYKKILEACVNQYPNQGETSIKNFYAWLNHPKNQGNSAVSALLHQQQHLRYSFNFYLERKEKEEFIFFHRVNEIKQKSKQSEFESNLIKNLDKIQGYPKDFSPLPDRSSPFFAVNSHLFDILN